MAKHPSRYAAVPPTQRRLVEYPLGPFAFGDDTPMSTVIESLSEPIQRAILVARHGFAPTVSIAETMKVTKLHIGQTESSQGNRSMLAVTYELLTKPPQGPRVPKTALREIGQPKTLLAQIGAGSRGGIAIFWHEESRRQAR